MKVIHVIGCLDAGGAETMLQKLLLASPTCHGTGIVSLTTIGSIGRELVRSGFSVRSLGLKPGQPDPRAVSRLRGWLRSEGSCVVQSWSYHADLISGLAGRSMGAPVVWGLHQSGLDGALHKRSTVATVRACARLSGLLPQAIVCCSHSTAVFHQSLGYRKTRLVVIPNGFDLDTFKPSNGARFAVRAELGINSDARLLGLVARFHPVKDHRNFLFAAREILLRHPDVHFVLVGEGTSVRNSQLRSWVEREGIGDRCHLLGLRTDVPRLTASFDVAVSASVSEGLPSTLGEAMAAEIPCVATDVGDSRRLVGPTGWIVPPASPKELAEACCAALDRTDVERKRLGQAARRRIAERFSIARATEAYTRLHHRIGFQAGFAHGDSRADRFDFATRW